MKKIIYLLFGFALSTLAAKAQTQLTQVDLSKYGLPFTMEMPLPKPEQLKVLSEKNIIDERRLDHEIIIDKGLDFAMAVNEVNLSSVPSTVEEMINGYKINDKQNNVYKVEKFIIEEPNLYLVEYKKDGSTAKFYDFIAIVRSSTKHYKFTSKTSKKYTEAQCKAMIAAIKSIKFK